LRLILQVSASFLSSDFFVGGPEAVGDNHPALPVEPIDGGIAKFHSSPHFTVSEATTYSI
jgi:hypothetical protein